MLIAWALAALAGDGTLHGYAVPTGSIDPDDGFGLGARAELYREEDDLVPYQWSLMAAMFFSIDGYMHHRLRYDRVGLGAHHQIRFQAWLAWRQWLNDGYYGIGNGTLRQRQFVTPDVDHDPFALRHYFYELFEPYARASLRAKLAGPWSAFGALQGTWTWVGEYPGSQLLHDQPYGVKGGPAVDIDVGALYDTRRPDDITPDGGVVVEASGRIAPRLSDRLGPFGGPFLSVRNYDHLGSRVVLATRAMGEWLFGDVPFYEMGFWGGLYPVVGFGGIDTIRGIAAGRWHGPGKLLLNAEFRIDVLHHQLFGRDLRWQVVPYVDAGAVFGVADAAWPAPKFPLHPAFGLGVHPIWDRAFVGRLDVGLGLDPVEELDGHTSWPLTLGFYVTFEHTY